MKKALTTILILLASFQAVNAADFSSEIFQVNSAGFPKIAVLLKVFNKTPVELKNDNFTISEDNTGISSFELVFQKNRHYMVLVIDRSSSIEPAMNSVKQAAAGFVQSMVSDVSMSVLSFGSDIDFNHEFSSDGESLVASIQKLRPWGGTTLYDALYSACEELNNKAGRSDLKTIVCLTDGRDSAPNGVTPMSTHTPDEVKKLAVDKGVRLITVGLGNDIDETVLKDFSRSTNGWYLQTTTPDQLSKLYEALSQRMKLERYYRLSYTTPKPSPDGTRRNIEIVSRLQGAENQGKGSYLAPTRTVHKPETEDAGERGGKMSVKSLFHDLHIDGPDSIFLTSPIIVTPATPVFGLNQASLLGLSQSEAQSVIEQTRARVSADHRANYEMQKSYLDGYSNALASMSAKVEENAARTDLKEFERPRIEYRRDYLKMRREEVEVHAQRAYDEYHARHTAAMAELDLFQQMHTNNSDFDSEAFESNSASLTTCLNGIDEKYDALLQQLSDKRWQHYSDTFDSRGANVEFNTTVTEEEIDLPSIPDPVSNNRPSVRDIKQYIKDRVPGADDDDSDSSDNTDIPELDILDN